MVKCYAVIDRLLRQKTPRNDNKKIEFCSISLLYVNELNMVNNCLDKLKHLFYYCGVFIMCFYKAKTSTLSGWSSSGYQVALLSGRSPVR